MTDAGVTGLPDADHGEVPMAWVVRKPESSISEVELQRYVAGKYCNWSYLVSTCFYNEHSSPRTVELTKLGQKLLRKTDVN